MVQHPLFLETFIDNKIIPKLLNFCVSNLHLKTSHAYHVCQIKLLRKEISVEKVQSQGIGKKCCHVENKIERDYV